MDNLNPNNRIKKIREIISRSHGVSDIIIFQEEDIFYLSGFFGKNSNSGEVFYRGMAGIRNGSFQG